MANDFWNNLVALTRRTIARAEVMNSILNAIKAGFDLLPSKARLYEERVAYGGLDTGVANNYAVATAYSFTLTDGARLSFKIANTNSGASVVTVTPAGASALSSVPIVTIGGLALSGGELLADQFVELRYNSTTLKFHIINPTVSIASVVVNNYLKITTSDTNPSVAYNKLAGLGALVLRILNAAGNEILQFKLRETQAVPIIANTTLVVGSINSIDTSAGAITALLLPAIGTGDTALQDGDLVDVWDVGGALETNNATISGNSKNIRYMDQAAAASLTLNSNFVRLRFRWDASADQWLGTGLYV